MALCIGYISLKTIGRNVLGYIQTLSVTGEGGLGGLRFE